MSRDALLNRPQLLASWRSACNAIGDVFHRSEDLPMRLLTVLGTALALLFLSAAATAQVIAACIKPN